MPVTSPALISPEDAPNRLAELGLRPADLVGAVQVGLAFAASCTRHDPLNLPGLLQWGRTIRGLRDVLVPQGWKSESDHNYPTVVSPDGTVALSVAGGDYFTGRAGGTPSTRSSKGPVTKAAVMQNQVTLAIVGGALVLATLPDIARLTPRSTWLLLHHHDKEAKEVRVELSLPAGFDDDDIVIAWHERILLKPFTTAYEPPEDDGGTAIDVPVTRG